MKPIVKKKILPPAGFDSWLDYAIATMDTRGPRLDKLFDSVGFPSQGDVRTAALDELVELRVLASKSVRVLNSNRKPKINVHHDSSGLQIATVRTGKQALEILKAAGIFDSDGKLNPEFV